MNKEKKKDVLLWIAIFIWIIAFVIIFFQFDKYAEKTRKEEMLIESSVFIGDSNGILS